MTTSSGRARRWSGCSIATGKTDEESGIVNDVNDWGLELDPPYILDLVKRIVTVSLETMEIVKDLLPLDEAD